MRHLGITREEGALYQRLAARVITGTRGCARWTRGA